MEKRKFLSLLLTIAIVIGMVPAAGTKVFAGGGGVPTYMMGDIITACTTEGDTSLASDTNFPYTGSYITKSGIDSQTSPGVDLVFTNGFSFEWGIAFASDCSVKLESNITISGITINDEVNVTLDLNGYSFNLNQSGIVDNGHLTIKNSSSGGIGMITNGSAVSGGGIYIASSASAIITDCQITGNVATCGGAVYGDLNSNILVSGCAISSNTADYGGGIYSRSNNSRCILLNTEVTSNSAIETGGGIYYASDPGSCFVAGSLTIGSGTTITNNTAGALSKRAENVYLADSASLIALYGDDRHDINVGITTATAPAVGAPVKFTSTSTYTDLSYFHSDSNAYRVKFATQSGSDAHLELVLNTFFDERFGGKYSLTGEEQGYTTYSALTSGSAYTVHDDVEYTFGGWYTGIDGSGTPLTGTPGEGATYYAKWINDYGNIVVTSSMNFKASPASTVPSGSGITWNELSKLVTLENATIDTGEQVALNLTPGSIVTVSGSGIIRARGTGDITYKKSAGIYSDQPGTLVITGSGALYTYSGDLLDKGGNFNDQSSHRLSAGIYANGSITISGITLYAESGKTDFEFGYSKYICGRSIGIFSTGKIAIDNAVVTAKASDGSVSINSPEKNGFSIGLHSYNNIEINNSTVTAVSGHARQDSDAIYAGWDFDSHTITAYGENNKYLANIIINNSSVTAISGTTTDYDTIGIYAHNSIYITGSNVTAKTGGARGSEDYYESRAAGIFRNEDLVIDNSVVLAEAYGNGIYTYSHANEEDQGKQVIFGRTYIKNNSVVTASSLDDNNSNTSGFAMMVCNTLSIDSSTLTCNTHAAGEDTLYFSDPNHSPSAIEGLTISGSGKIITNGIVKVSETDSENPYYFGNTSNKKYSVTGGEVSSLDGRTNIVSPKAGETMIIMVAAPIIYDDPAPSITVPVTGDKSSVNVQATVSGSNASVNNITEKEIEEAGTGSNVVVDLSGLSKTVTGVTLPKLTFENVAASDASGLEIKMPSGTVAVFDKAVLSAVAEQAKGRRIQLVVDRDDKAEGTMTTAQQQTVAEMHNPVVLDAYFVSNGIRISDFKGGEACISASYKTEYPVRVWYVADDGEKTLVPSSFNGELASFTVNHFSHYVIESLDGSSYNVCPQDETCVYAGYPDTNTMAWYHNGVHYCVENKYMIGYTNGNFGPSDTLSRAMVVTMLWNLEGKPCVDYAMSFEDVAPDMWYAEAIRWAQSTGIVEGYSDAAFGPADNITREQLAKIYYSYAKYKGLDVSESAGNSGSATVNTGTAAQSTACDDSATANTASAALREFTDAASVHSWAQAAVEWAVSVKLVEGKAGGILDPRGSATRAEAAAILLNYCVNIAK